MTKLDAASYIAGMANELKKIAVSHKLNTEAYLLDMAFLAASGSARAAALAQPAEIEPEIASRSIMPLVAHDDMQAAAG